MHNSCDTCGWVRLLVLSGLLLASSGRAADLYYVNDDAAGANTGLSWADAFTSLQSALGAAVSGNAIWVAAGTYTPGETRAATFQLKNGVALYGGFAGIEEALAQRDWDANQSVLSGEIGLSVDVEDNIDHLITGEHNSSLDGFVVAHAFSTGNGGGMQIIQKGPITLRHCTFTNNYAIGSGNRPGGAAIYFNSAAGTGLLTIDRCRFFDNISLTSGGGILVRGQAGNLRVENSIFAGNRRGQGYWAADVGNTEGSLSSVGHIVNCTFVNAWYESVGAGVMGANANTGHLKLLNCILWKDGIGTNWIGRVMNNAQLTIDTCLIDGYWNIGSSGGTVLHQGTISSNDPQFVDLPTRDLRVQVTSPVIDAGVANTDPAIIMPTVDFLGRIRPAGTAYDLGAYEGGVALVPPSGALLSIR